MAQPGGPPANAALDSFLASQGGGGGGVAGGAGADVSFMYVGNAEMPNLESDLSAVTRSITQFQYIFNLDHDNLSSTIQNSVLMMNLMPNATHDLLGVQNNLFSFQQDIPLPWLMKPETIVPTPEANQSTSVQ